MKNFLLDSGMKGRFVAYGLPTYLAHDLSVLVRRYVDNSGPAWTVSRLKSLKLDLIRERAGLPPVTWVRKNRNGHWFGILGALRSYAKKSDRCFKTVVNCLMCYSGFVPSNPTKEHLDKFRSSVSASPVFIPQEILLSFAEHTLETGLTCPSPDPARDFTPLIYFQGAQSVKSPFLRGSSVKQSEFLEKELDHLTDEKTQDFVRWNWDIYQYVFSGLKRKEVLPGPPSWECHGSDSTPWGGRVIPLMKDGGWKVRWIASPARIHQLALLPLGDSLYKLLKEIPWDCTFDQTKAIPSIQQHLKQGRRAFAVDLSSATDYFPLSLQRQVLLSLNRGVWWSQHVDLFCSLARARWSSPIGEISWTKGQPMGLYPSFASFALTHGILLDYLRTSPGQQFFILGDDVVILSEELHERYVEALKLLECPHEPTKTISSNRLTEFAGKIILPDKVIPQFKWRKVSGDNFLELMRHFGQKFSTQLSTREKAVYDQVAGLLPPYGCGHSSGPAKGITSAVEKTDEFEMGLETKKERKFYMSFLGFLTDRLRPERNKSLWYKLRPEKVARDSEAFDEKAARATFDTPFWGFKGDLTPCSDVLGLTDFVGLPALVPSKETSRESLLEWYEKVLKKTGNTTS